MKNKILVAGGAGYIGSHTCVELLNAGKEIIIVDNLSNSKIEVIDKIKKLTNKEFDFYKLDVNNKEELSNIFAENKDIDSVINFAGFKSVGESVKEPLKYYSNNISGALTLLETMKEFNVKKFIFSSSATVYGNAEIVPIHENCSTGGEITNPYGKTKYMIEEILKDLHNSDKSWGIVILRYFNPIGAHESGLIGEEPNGIPNNLLPYISKVANGELEIVSVFGDDYDTKDGTGVRDYIHVVDLANGHLKAIEKLESNDTEEDFKLNVYNLGTGNGYSVLDLIKTFEEVNNIEVPYKIIERRAGDIGTCYSDPIKAESELGWKAKYSLEDMCRDSWNYQKNNKKYFN